MDTVEMKAFHMMENIHSFPTRRSSDSEERRVGKECMSKEAKKELFLRNQDKGYEH